MRAGLVDRLELFVEGTAFGHLYSPGRQSSRAFGAPRRADRDVLSALRGGRAGGLPWRGAGLLVIVGAHEAGDKAWSMTSATARCVLPTAGGPESNGLAASSTNAKAASCGSEQAAREIATLRLLVTAYGRDGIPAFVVEGDVLRSIMSHGPERGNN